MFRFAQGVFSNFAGDRAGDALVALGGYRRYRSILVALDRMDVTSPHVYARTVEAARRLSDELSGRDERNAVVAFQSALAILERARLTQEIEPAAAEKLLLTLADVIDPPADGAGKARPFAAITQWMITTMLEALPPLVQPDEWTTPGP